ncbi:MAG: Smr/MutS family protein, partial [Gemmatimonadota bacterium]
QVAARERAAAEGLAVADARGVTLAIGDAVAVESLGGKVGQLLERRGEDAVVAVGPLKMTVPFAALRRLSAKHLRSERVEVAALDLPVVEAKPEVDVRGVRVHEVDDLVLQALDGAIRADLAQVRIIHGKGTGALRERVAQVLKGDRRVKQFRLGAWNEGGAGVTIAEFA